MKKTTKVLRLQTQVATWNAEHPVGTLVRYWRGVREGEPSGVGKVRWSAELLGGHTPVVWIEGCTGCVALTHVESVAPQNPLSSIGVTMPNTIYGINAIQAAQRAPGTVQLFRFDPDTRAWTPVKVPEAASPAYWEVLVAWGNLERYAVNPPLPEQAVSAPTADIMPDRPTCSTCPHLLARSPVHYYDLGDRKWTWDGGHPQAACGAVPPTISGGDAQAMVAARPPVVLAEEAPGCIHHPGMAVYLAALADATSRSKRSAAVEVAGAQAPDDTRLGRSSISVYDSY